MNRLTFLFPFGLFLLYLSTTLLAQTNRAPQPHDSASQTRPTPALSDRPPESASGGHPAQENFGPQTVQVTVPAGTPIRVALTERVRIWRDGTPVQGKVTGTVYAFDRAVIPAGSEIHGQVTQVARVPKMRRAMAMANADFSPAHDYRVIFDTIIMSDGRRLPVVTTVAPGVQEVVHIVSDPAGTAKKKNAAAQSAERAKREVNNRVHDALGEIKSLSHKRRIKQLLLAQLPYRRQYLEPGTSFDADLEAPLDFGLETRAREQLSSVATRLEPESTLHARLTSEVSSATAHRGAPIDAVVTEPVFNPEHRLVLPTNSVISGEVTSAKPAGKLHHNGELRIVFGKITTPEGMVQTTQGSLEAVELDRAANLKLDTEGGAHAEDSRSRYLSTGLAIGIAVVAAHPESDNGAPDGLADPATRTAAGGSGFRLVGALVSLTSGSKVFASVLGVYGASRSIWSHFLSHGKDVVLPKDTPVEIGLSERQQRTKE